MSVVGANTDLLNSELLEPAARLMKTVDDNFGDATAANTPPGRVRTDTDAEIAEHVRNSAALVTAVLQGVRALSNGDTESVNLLNNLLSRVAETSTDLARQVGGDGPSRH